MIDVFDAREIAIEEAKSFFSSSENERISKCFVTVSSKREKGIACYAEQDACNCEFKYVFKCVLIDKHVIANLCHVY